MPKRIRFETITLHRRGLSTATEMWNTILPLLAIVSGLGQVSALGEPQVLHFPETHVFGQNSAQKPFEHQEGLTIASSPHKYATPLLLDSKDNVAIHLAARTFANDVYRVTGVRPEMYNDTLPKGTKEAFIVGSASSDLIGNTAGAGSPSGTWESYDVRIVPHPATGIERALVAVGSDRRGTIYALYTLSEIMGVSPFHFWSDVPVKQHDTVVFLLWCCAGAWRSYSQVPRNLHQR